MRLLQQADNDLGSKAVESWHKPRLQPSGILAMLRSSLGGENSGLPIECLFNHAAADSDDQLIKSFQVMAKSGSHLPAKRFWEVPSIRP